LKKDRNQWQKFLEFSQKWREVNQARAFIESIEEQVLDQDHQVGDRTLQEWLTWVRKWADEQDPLATGIDALFNSISEVKSYTY